MSHFAISAANFSISTLALQKQHSFKHKSRFYQVHEHKSQIKTILHFTQILRCDTREMQKKRQSLHGGNITLNSRPLQ